VPEIQAFDGEFRNLSGHTEFLDGGNGVREFLSGDKIGFIGGNRRVETRSGESDDLRLASIDSKGYINLYKRKK
jgi:hypothetical protein